jgi:transcriptional regulator with XRE-family HTH domain
MARGTLSERPDRQALAHNVRRLRLGRGWSQEELAAFAGELRQAVISQIETATANPTFDTLEHIAAALGVRVFDLLKPRRRMRSNRRTP